MSIDKLDDSSEKIEFTRSIYMFVNIFVKYKNKRRQQITINL